MDNSELRLEETRAERARAKLAADLDKLQSPATYDQFKQELKQEVTRVKDDILSHTQRRVRSTFEEWIDDVKAQAAANPAATLMIGAGLVYRLLKNPPIASLLVGAGVYGLLKTADHHRPHATEDYVDHAKTRMKEQASVLTASAAEATSIAAGAVSREASDLFETVQDKAGNVIISAKEAAVIVTKRAAEVKDQATRAIHDVEDVISREAQNARKSVASVAKASREYVPTGSDGVLLAIAGIAVSTALGIALQKRLSDADFPRREHRLPLA